MNPGKVWLVGLMGSGKTTVGSRLAGLLECGFVDSDAQIEQLAGRKIREIFAEEGGEARFRALERETAVRLSALDGRWVVALGGGAVLDAGTRRWIRETGVVAWLEAPPEVLAARAGAGDDRPLLAGADEPGVRAARLRELAEVRRPLYDEVADFVADTSGPAERAAAALAAWVSGLRTVRVDLGPRSYDAIFERGGLARLGRRLRRQGLRPSRVALVVDGALPREHVDRATEGLREGGLAPAAVTALPGGEACKRLTAVELLLDAWGAAGLDRTSVAVALGGGALTDAAGFAASIYLRGIACALCPTTLLGMVDAAIGGKTAVNLAAGKNLAGSFAQPRLVLADPETLATLPEREVRSGFAEVLKCALIGPAALFDQVGRAAALDAPLPVDLLAAVAALKAGVVARDERETSGERKVLNFGHTIGHAIEAASDFALAHGEAVLLGMRAALFLSTRKGLLPAAERDRLLAFLARVPAPPFPAALGDAAILEHLRPAKKAAHGKLLFVLLRGPGDPAIDVECDADDAAAALAFLRGEGPAK